MSYYYYYSAAYPKHVLVYIEEYNRKENEVIFDFIDSKEFSKFSLLLNIFSTSQMSSMAKLMNYKGRRITENTIYAIRPNVLKKWFESRIINTEIDSFLLGFEIELGNDQEEIFGSSISINNFRDELALNYIMRGVRSLEGLPLKFGEKLEVIIRDVGQGNWNEVWSNNICKLIYDIGAPIFATKSEVRELIDKRITEYKKNKPGLILSHWDKDHYHALLGMSDDELSSFSFFVFRDWVPNLTSRRIFSRIYNLLKYDKMFSIGAEYKEKRGGPVYLTPISPTENQLVIYNSQYHKNRNISGIVMSLKTVNSSVIFSGDQQYTQISRDILPALNYTHKHHLIVPHHGGLAGVYQYDLPQKLTAGMAIISVGLNKYGHPLKNNVNQLKNHFTVRKTLTENADIKIQL